MKLMSHVILHSAGCSAFSVKKATFLKKVIIYALYVCLFSIFFVTFDAVAKVICITCVGTLNPV